MKMRGHRTQRGVGVRRIERDLEIARQDAERLCEGHLGELPVLIALAARL
jgi:hypothetical protein